ncbi:hypothetical protein NECAME_16405 [Necator americanus]|uniref:Uncharacterized protein n=1 Tax=Necator americanus TaxID=51031 RepID=W2TXF5_NECAM|nr:hypothetical protein NECAME_16405 [Necator americanus]ETN86334.1 hypothetical protein NECAME_16405 [Necator americanus]
MVFVVVASQAFCEQMLLRVPKPPSCDESTERKQHSLSVYNPMSL